MAEAWVTITEEEIKTAMTAKERDIFGMTVVDGTPSDRVPAILSDVTALVRSYIGSCERNLLDANAALIPRMAMHHALAIARWRLLTSIPMGRLRRLPTWSCSWPRSCRATSLGP